MENASKALLIAGGVLIAILIVMIGIVLMGDLGKVSESYMYKIDITELQNYNKHFDVFVGRSDITAQEIVTVINVAKQTDRGTKVYITISGTTKEYTADENYNENEFLTDNILTYKGNNTVVEEKINLYSIDTSKGDNNEGINYNNDGMITAIHFIKNP